jgi:hypothetical protein
MALNISSKIAKWLKYALTISLFALVSVFFLSTTFEGIDYLILIFFWISSIIIFAIIILFISVYFYAPKPQIKTTTANTDKSSGDIIKKWDKKAIVILVIIAVVWIFLIFIGPRFYFIYVSDYTQASIVASKAIANNNPSLCGLIRLEPSIIPVAFLFGGGSGQSLMDDCYELVAEGLKNEDICIHISNVSFGYYDDWKRDNCIEDIAEIKNNPDVCKKMNDSKKIDSCIVNVTKRLKDTNIRIIHPY